MMPAIVNLARRAVTALCLASLVAVPVRADEPIPEHWRRPGVTRPGFTKIVVVGITHDAAARRRYEDLFVSLLRGRSFQGITSYSIVPDLANVPDPDKVVEQVLADQVDGVFTVRLVPLADKDAQKAWPAAWHADLESPQRVRDYVQTSISHPPSDAKMFGAEVSVWEVSTGNRLWAARGTPMKRKSLHKDASWLTQGVMDQLVFEQLF